MSESKGSPGPWRWAGLTGQLVANGEVAVLDTCGKPYLAADATMIRLAPEMAAMLRELEWSGTGRCPSCTEVSRHAPDCRLAALLGEIP